MTTRDKHQLLSLLNQYNMEEVDCEGDCNSCYYFIKQQHLDLQCCPFLVAYDMIYEKVFHRDVWNERKG